MAILSNLRRRATDILTQPVDVASLAFFRLWFGGVMIWHVHRYFSSDWIFDYYIGPKFHFKYYGFTWVEAWPDIGMYLHFMLMGVCALCIFVGFAYRLNCLLFFLLFTYTFLLDQARYLNHYYLVCLVSFLMVFLPAHRSLSVDAWLRPTLRSEFVPAWPLALLRTQLGLVYLFAAVAKMNPDWLAGEPLRMWLAERQDYTLLGPVIPVGKLFTQEWFVQGFGYGGLLFDLLVVPLLMWRRTRAVAFLWCIAFHLTNAWLFDIGIFPWFMLGATMVFFDPDWPRRVFNWPNKSVVDKSSVSLGTHGLTTCLLVLYLVIQVAVPLRHFLYPGKVHWTEEGHRFAWHMKLRDKAATAKITVVDPDSGERTVVDAATHLTARQQRKSSTRPDMLLQFCHYLAAKYERRGRPAEVYAEVYCSLNGHPSRLLIDPRVNLAAEKRSLMPAQWIFPFDEAPLEVRGER